MKKWIHAAEDFNNELTEEQSISLSQLKNKYRQQKRNYVHKIEGKIIADIEEDIRTQIFDPELSRIGIISPDADASVYLYATSRYIQLVVNVYHSTTNNDNGLLWLADIVTGGDGSFRSGWWTSSTPKQIKMKLKEYTDKIATIIEENGLTVINIARPNPSVWNGPLYYVTDSYYQTLVDATPTK